MTTSSFPKSHKLVVVASLIALTSLVQSCTPPIEPSAPPKNIKLDGSSTVYPITKAIAERYNAVNVGKINAESAFSGTGGGFKKFCAGETDINDASRPILTKEIEICRQNNVRYMELAIAYDAVTVVVNPQNTWAKDLTTAELKKIWSADGVKTWDLVRPGFPKKPIKLFGPGKDSGTYDYFVQAILGKDVPMREDYTASEDDNVLVAGVSGDPNAIGYFGFAYYQANKAKLRALSIDNGKGAIAPSAESVTKVQYQPLSRPLFIYVNFASTQRKEINTFVSFYLDNASKVVEKVGYISLPPEGIEQSKATFTKGEIGTVFDGKAEINLPIAELLKKRAQF
jgi:phosphate transport system substrate-binding protein